MDMYDLCVRSFKPGREASRHASTTCATVGTRRTSGAVVAPSAMSFSTFRANRSASRLTVKVRCILRPCWRQWTS